jgi:hypothetical protein
VGFESRYVEEFFFVQSVLSVSGAHPALCSVVPEVFGG